MRQMRRMYQSFEEKNVFCLKDKNRLCWVSHGKTNWEASQILSMIHRTANKHLKQIYKKLGVDNRTFAAAITISIRILESTGWTCGGG